MRHFSRLFVLIAMFVLAATHHAYAANAAILKATEAEFLLVYLGIIGAIFFLGYAALMCVL